MTMTPERFRELLEAGTADAPPTPLPADDLSAGRTRLRRRRTAQGAALAVAATVVIGAVGVGTRLGGDERGVEPIAPVLPDGPSHAEVDRVVAACQDAIPAARVPGPVRVVSIASSGYSVEVLLASEQGRYWAGCSEPVGTSDARPEVTAYDAQTPSEGGPGIATRAMCAKVQGCRLLGYGFVDRRDPAVAAVRIDLGDGTSRTIETTDGYFAVSGVMVLPDGTSFDEHGFVSGIGRGPLRRMAFLDASGTTIAEDVYDGTGSGEFHNEVPGVPPLEDAYPSLAGDNS